MSIDERRLKRELRQAGARSSEIDGLVDVATKLRVLGHAQKRTSRKHLAGKLKPVLMMSSALALGMIVIMLAQSATPTSWLYPVQKLSDAVAIKAHPEYRATVMMRRAEQVNALVSNHAPSRTILSTLDSYETEAADYKAMAHADYAAFDYCKTNLEQAAAAAPAGVRGAIVHSLDSLNTT